MRFNIYGRFLIEVLRQDNQWVVYRLGNEGKKRLAHDIQLSPELDKNDVQEQLAILYHEYATEKHSEVSRVV